ncbi:MAG: carboxypeptidase-like regulatory domain-containing protein [Pseudomonadota bacterium]
MSPRARLATWLLCCCMAASAWAGAADGLAARYPAPDPGLIAIVELHLGEELLSDALTAYQYGAATYLPLGELARLLSLAVKAQPGAGTAAGFIVSEERVFHLDLARASATLAGRELPFDPGAIRLQADDIYVESGLLATWLPVDFALAMGRLTVTVLPREKLPLQLRLERERWQRRAPAGGDGGAGLTRLDQAYRLYAAPVIDQTVSLSAARAGGALRGEVASATYLAGDLLGMQASAFVNLARGGGAARLTLARHDPQAGLLGPLRARALAIGSDAALPFLPYLDNAKLRQGGTGLAWSNRPLDQPEQFDRISLSGDLAEGWDVQLFYNNALIGFQAARADGRYQFDALSLAYGPNLFRLVFHGPTGQVRVEQKSVLLDQASVPDATFYYDLAARTDPGLGRRAALRYQWGLSRMATLDGGFQVQQAGPTGAGGAYANLGLRAYLRGMIVNAMLARAPDGAVLSEVGLKTSVAGVAVSVVQLRPRGFVSPLLTASPDPLRVSHQLDLDTVLSSLSAWPMPLTVGVRSDRRASGARASALLARISGQVLGVALSNQLEGQVLPGRRALNGLLQMSRPIGDTSFGVQLNYALRPQRQWVSAMLGMNRRLFDDYALTVNMTRTIAGGGKQLLIGLNRNFGAFSMGISAAATSGAGLALGLRLFSALGYEPRQAHYQPGPMAQMGSTAASVHVFLDKNNNGSMDGDDEPLRDIGLIVNGARRPQRTDGAGLAYLSGLPIKQNLDIALDRATLEDPYWAPSVKGVRYLARQGAVNQITLPVHMTGEIDGTALVADDAGRRHPIGDVQLELRDAQGALAASVKSAADGYFLFLSVAPGSYTLGMSSAQAERLALQPPPRQALSISPQGQVINGVTLVLRGGAPARPARPDAPR